MPTLRDVGEFEAIRRLTRARGGARAIGPEPAASVRRGGNVRPKQPEGQLPAEAGPDDVVIGSGDDAAILRPPAGHDLVATTDAFVEGRHYAPAWFEAREIGARLAIANLSDFAAMAARPRWALLSIGARGEHELDALVALQDGLAEALAAEGASVVGGNLAAVDGAEWLSLTLLGETPHGRGWTRSGARAGDLLAVTGAPGRAGAGCLLARRLGAEAGATAWRPLLDAWIRPSSRVKLALALRSSDAVTAAIDVSDGFGGDLAHLCEASGLGAEIVEASWPADPLLERAAEKLDVGLEVLRFGPSDDYELILAVDPRRRAACEETARASGVSLAIVGHFTDAPGALTLVTTDGGRRALPSGGFDHFALS